MMEWALVTAPTIEPLTVAEAKTHARITHTSEDGLIDSYIKAARQAAEDVLNRGLLTQTWKLVLDDFANEIWLPMAAPLQSVTTVQYYDTAGALQTLATSVYDVDTVSRPGKVVLKADQSWPSVQTERRSGAVIITYVVGWLTAAAIPPRIRQGVRLYVAALDANRDGLTEDFERGVKAAEACWADRIYWRDPVCL